MQAAFSIRNLFGNRIRHFSVPLFRILLIGVNLHRLFGQVKAISRSNRAGNAIFVFIPRPRKQIVSPRQHRQPMEITFGNTIPANILGDALHVQSSLHIGVVGWGLLFVPHKMRTATKQKQRTLWRNHLPTLLQPIRQIGGAGVAVQRDDAVKTGFAPRQAIGFG